MASRLFLIIASSIFALLGIISDQLAYQIDEELNASFRFKDQVASQETTLQNLTINSGQLRDTFLLGSILDTTPSDTRLNHYDQLKRDFLQQKSTLASLDASITNMQEYHNEGALDTVRNYRKTVELKITSGKYEWREKYYWTNKYFDLQQTYAEILSQSLEAYVDSLEYNSGKLALQRQIFISVAITASLGSLFFLLLYLKQMLNVLFIADNTASKTQIRLFRQRSAFIKRKNLHN